jgi:hypothetical protein
LLLCANPYLNVLFIFFKSLASSSNFQTTQSIITSVHLVLNRFIYSLGKNFSLGAKSTVHSLSLMFDTKPCLRHLFFVVFFVANPNFCCNPTAVSKRNNPLDAPRARDAAYQQETIYSSLF